MTRKFIRIQSGLAVAIVALAGHAFGADPWRFTSTGRAGFTVLDEELTPLLNMDNSIHGKTWVWTSGKEMSRKENDTSIYRESFKEPYGQYDYKMTMAAAEGGKVVIDVECKAITDVEFTGIGLVFNSTRGQNGGQIEFSAAKNGSTMPLPIKGYAMPEATSQAMMTFADKSTITMEFSPPIAVHADRGSARFWFFTGKIPAGETRKQKMTLSFSKPIKLNMGAETVDTSSWFPLALKNDHSHGSPLGMEDWLDKPAGKHGFAQMKGKDFVFEDGTPIKFWGVNACTAAPTKEYFDKWAERLSKYGVNIARIVAFARPDYPNTWAHYVKIQDVKDGMTFSDDAMALFDYGFAAFKKQGIYSGFSPFYGWYPTPGDKARLINYDEIMKVLRKDFPATHSFYCITSVAPDLQDAYIDFTVKLLNHVNPHTGKRYADDPAVAWVELMNEENTYLQLFDLQRIVDQIPTYKKLYYEKFAVWLKAKYSNQEALAKAWDGLLKADETIAAANISPCPAWFSQPNKRQTDQMAFIYANQLAFYRKFKEKVLATGYRGAVDGSCWQASEWIGHLYNVKLDSDIGFIDRHNYGGNPMLCDPGTGVLSCGMQQVGVRPFNCSEWAYGLPVAEEVPIMAVYGMGLQGWDGSQQFATHGPNIWLYYGAGCNDTCDQFENIAQYPAVARMLYRGDVKEGAIAASRRVSFTDLQEKGDVGFREEFSLLGHANHKEFSSVIPQAALGVGRVTLDYVDGPVADPIVKDYEKFIDTGKKEIRSNTGQLLWSYRGHGYFTANTPGTQAVIGFAKGGKFSFGDVEIAMESEFACLYISARNPKETLADAKEVIITAMARTTNQGTTLDALTLRVLAPPNVPAARQWDKAYWEKNHPLIVEPVTASITFKNRKVMKVITLDHDGRLPQEVQALPVKALGNGSSFTIDGKQTKTMYYLVEMK